MNFAAAAAAAAAVCVCVCAGVSCWRYAGCAVV